MLILDNINVPVNNENDLFRSVTTAWFTALRAIENLVKGVPQQVQDGAALLGMSPWHLYPDMVILGVTADVKQQDPLLLSSALLTLGLQFTDKSRNGVSWSLPLAHLRYYGHPVQSSCSVSPANSRISIDQFAYVMLGCVFGGWNEYGSTPIIGITWLLRLHDLLENFRKRLDDTALPAPNSRMFSTPQTNTTSIKGVRGVLARNSWMRWLFDVGNFLLDSRGLERKLAMQLVTLGKRRTAALCPGQNVPCPLFGLSDPSILMPIMSNHEARIEFLRGLARKLSLESIRHVIRYKHDSSASICPFEYATTRPSSGIQQHGSTIHRRYLPITAYHQATNVLSCICSPICAEACPCNLRNTDCSLLCHNGQGTTVRNCKNSALPEVLRRSFAIPLLAEEPEPLCELLPYKEGVSYADVLIKFSSGASFESGLNSLLRQDTGTPLRDFVGLKLVCGDPDTAAIFELDYAKNIIIPYAPAMTAVAAEKSYMPQELLEDALKVDMLDLDRLIEWLATFRKPQTAPILARHTIAPNMQNFGPVQVCNPRLYSEYSSSLRAGMIAAQVYKLLPDATISTTVVSQHLWLSKWLPPHPEPHSHLLSVVELSRAQAFACIAMFDSGSCNLDPAGLQEAFALCSGNSIYVAAALLCDPSEVPTAKEIRRVTGSIGRSGITVLAPPGEPKCRAIDDESWIHINHLPFDGKLENCFQQTTLHLTFTAYELPLSDGSHGRHIIDRPASLVETVVSVHDRE